MDDTAILRKKKKKRLFFVVVVDTVQPLTISTLIGHFYFRHDAEMWMSVVKDPYLSSYPPDIPSLQISYEVSERLKSLSAGGLKYGGQSCHLKSAPK